LIGEKQVRKRESRWLGEEKEKKQGSRAQVDWRRKKGWSGEVAPPVTTAGDGSTQVAPSLLCGPSLVWLYEPSSISIYPSKNITLLPRLGTTPKPQKVSHRCWGLV
jgi:hypothetical protein